MEKQSEQRIWSGYNPIVVTSVLLLTSLLLAFLIFSAQSEHKKNFDQYLLAASEQQVLAHQIAKYAVESASGNESSFARLEEARDRSSVLMSELIEGSVEKNLPPSPETIQPTLSKVEEAWQVLESHIDSVLLNQSVIVRADVIVNNMKQLLPGLLEVADSSATQLVKSGSKKQVYNATRQLFLAQQINTVLSEILDGGDTSAIALNNLTENIDELEEVVRTLIDGDNTLKIIAVKDGSAQKLLNEVLRHLAQVQIHQNELLDMIGELLPALTALGTVGNETSGGLDKIDENTILAVASDNLASLDGELITLFSSSADVVQFGFLRLGENVTFFFRTASVVLFLLLGYLLITQSRRREKDASKLNVANQNAIRTLLGEMRELANGDLSIEATVTEDITGTIADAINASIESMRDVVFSINDTSEKVSSTAQKNQSIISELVKASVLQGNEIESASDVSENMTKTLELMAEKAKLLAEVTVDSLKLAEKGGTAVNQNIEGMEKLREQIQGTSKRIKRLGESSQEIGSIIDLINGITDQTNILAMNASMQAAMAGGDAGRGFAIVADEVQRLAERSANATKQIKTLVTAIQTDTSEAVASMESSISEVLNGAKLAEEAGRALQEIEEVSQQVTENTTEMATSAQSQSEKAASLNEGMQSVQKMTKQISKGVKSTASGIVYLVDNVSKLRNSVDEFVLPEEN